MRTSSIRCLLGLCLLAMAAAGGATVYYVSPSGNDSWDGRYASSQGGSSGPWRYPQTAANHMVAGDTVYVRAGTYTEIRHAPAPVYTAILGAVAHGTAVAPITFRNYPGETPVLDSQYNARCLLIENDSQSASWNVYEGFDLANGSIELGMVVGGFGVDNITIRKCRIHGARKNMVDNTAGIFFSGGMTGLVVESNEIYDNYQESQQWHPNSCGAMLVYPTGAMLRGNVVHDEGSGTRIKHGGSGEVAWYGNTVYHCTYGLGGANEHARMERNIIYDCQSGVRTSSGHISVYGVQSMRIANNTVVARTSSSDCGCYTFQQSDENNYGPDFLRVRNNIAAGGYAGHTVTYGAPPWFTSADPSDYNCFVSTLGRAVMWDLYGGSQESMTLARFRQATGDDMHSIASDPMFENAAAYDFRLRTGSPCIGTGEGGVDMGAIPYGSAAPTVPPTVTITTPSSSPTHTTAQATIALGGTASDSDGTVASVAWSNDRGGSGSAAGITTWSVASVALQSGANVITVTATDDDGLYATDVITVTHNPVVPDTTPPYVEQQSPAPGATDVPRNTVVRFHVRGADSGVDASTLVLRVNGSPVTPGSVTGAPADLTVLYDPPGEFSPLAIVTIAVEANDLATTPNHLTTSWSFTCSDTNIVIQPPLPPSGLAAPIASTNSLLLQFTASPSATVAGYYLYYRNGTVGYAQVDIGNATSYLLGGLHPGTTYHLALTAYDAADQESDLTPEITVTTVERGGSVVTNPPPGGETNAVPAPEADELELRPNRVGIADVASVLVLAPASLAGRTVEVYAVSGAKLGAIELDEDARARLVDLSLPLETGIYIFADSEGLYRARLVVAGR